ncbi:hypothetical protein B9031_025665 [Klebsiella aerogenes]|nr:hypothetical protein B9031_025665 [Klebsiella aerogenes]
MCGRFSQSMTREDYLSLIADEALTEFLVFIQQRARVVTRVDHRPATVLAQLSLREQILCMFWLPRGGRIDNT